MARATESSGRFFGRIFALLAQTAAGGPQAGGTRQAGDARAAGNGPMSVTLIMKTAGPEIITAPAAETTPFAKPNTMQPASAAAPVCG